MIASPSTEPPQPSACLSSLHHAASASGLSSSFSITVTSLPPRCFRSSRTTARAGPLVAGAGSALFAVPGGSESLKRWREAKGESRLSLIEGNSSLHDRRITTRRFAESLLYWDRKTTHDEYYGELGAGSSGEDRGRGGGSVSDPEDPGAGRDGDGISGGACADQTARGHQDPASGSGHRRRRDRALHERGSRGRNARPSQHRRVDGHGVHGQSRPVHRVRVPRRHAA